MAIFYMFQALIDTLAAWHLNSRQAFPGGEPALPVASGAFTAMLRIAEDGEAATTETGADVLPAGPHESGSTLADGEHCDEQLDSEVAVTDSEVRAALVEAEAELALMRIECDELKAQVARLESLSPPDGDSGSGDPANELPQAAPDNEPCTDDNQAEPPDDIDALKACLARRERTALDMKKRLKQSEQRVRELKLTLRSWKHRVAPLAQQLNLQRELIRELRNRDKKGASADSENTLQ